MKLGAFERIQTKNQNTLWTCENTPSVLPLAYILHIWRTILASHV